MSTDTKLLVNAMVVEGKPAPTKEKHSEWPISAGWESTINAIDPVELSVHGDIPQYAAGVLYRTGPGGYKVQTRKGTTHKRSHWFDGFSQVHRFQIIPSAGTGSRVIYNSRFTADEQMQAAKKNGTLEGLSFGQKRDPCESFFKNAMSSFKAMSSSKRPEAPNIGVTLSVNMPGLPSDGQQPRGHASGITTLTAKTDATPLLRLDPETLEPIGVATQNTLHPELSGPMSGAHAKSDPKTGDVYNFNCAPGPKPMYRVFCVSAATGKTKILARIHAPVAYLHSLFITEEHVILCVWNSFIAGNGAKVLWTRNVLDAIAPFDKSKPATWYVVDRLHNRGLLATFESDPFFAFHTINAWSVPSRENEATRDIVAEVCTYSSLDVLHSYYYENLLAPMSADSIYREDGARPRLQRFRLPGVPVVSSPQSPLKPSTAPKHAQTMFTAPTEHSAELPTMNPAFLTQQHQFTYGVVDQTGKCAVADGLVKFDWNSKQPVFWSAEDCAPGEPIFVADPDSDQEDGGVLLSVVLDEKRKSSFLLVLDARTMGEIGRAEVGGVIGFGFHGVHVSQKKERAVDI